MSGSDDRELRALADDIARFRAMQAPPAMRARIRAALLAAPVVPQRRSAVGWAGVLRAVVAVLVVALLAMGGAAAASSLPGDPAFALKRGVEEVQVALAPDQFARLDTLVAQSDRRLSELEFVVARRAEAIAPAVEAYLGAVGRVESALAGVTSQPATPARDVAIARVAGASTDHLARLQALAAVLPAAAQPGLQRAIEAQQSVHGSSGDAPDRDSAPNVAPTASGRPSTLPPNAPGINATPTAPPTRGGAPTGVPGRP